MNPLFALLQTVRDELAAALNLHTGSQIDTRVDELTHAFCGDLFLGIFGNSMVDGRSPDPEMGLDQSFSINISVTQRTGYVPDDKMFQHGAMNEKKGCLTIAQRVARNMQIRRLQIPHRATQRLDGSEWLGRFVEPLKLSSSAISIRKAMPSHFHASPPDAKGLVHCKDFGLFTVITYSGARYMESLIAETVALNVTPELPPANVLDSSFTSGFSVGFKS